MDEKCVLSILRGGKGWNYGHSSIADFKQHLNEAALSEENFDDRWVLWSAYEQELDVQVEVQHKIITMLKHIASDFCFKLVNFLVQFWAVDKVEGSHHYLSTSRQPFYVSKLLKGNSWYRKKCLDHVYDVDFNVPEAEAEHLGGVGRAYRNKRPESTPDLRLYTSNEFPLRDQAARCGFRAYTALPLFDIHTNECYGVLEFLSIVSTLGLSLFSELDQGLQIAGLRSTHIPISRYARKMPEKYKQQPENEIKEILELAIKAVPQLSLAQVWVPCNHCANLGCMERAAFITAEDKTLNQCDIYYPYMIEYIQACDFHNLQSHDLGISKNPLTHYIQRASLSIPLFICLQSVVNNNNHVFIEYFLKCREDDDSCVKLLLRIMGMKLKSFKFFLGELEVQSRQYNAIECEAIEMLNVMDSYVFSNWNFMTEYMETVDLCCSPVPPFTEKSNQGWVFCPPVGEGLCENDDVVKEKILHFMKQRAAKFGEKDCMVQFWAPKKVGNRYYLQTSDQPYAVGCLAKGLASYRKKCMQHRYFVDDVSKEEELGPPGRVFRNGHTEAMPDLCLYSTKEFSLRNYALAALHCGFADYFVLPLFDEHKHNCVGVLEFIGCKYPNCIVRITRELQSAKLRVSHNDYRSTLLSLYGCRCEFRDDCKFEALTELQHAMLLFSKIPQFYMLDLWVPTDGRCIDSKLKCMQVKHDFSTDDDIYEMDWIHVESRMGLIGMVLDSESKSCFCRNICEFSIAHEPLAPYYRKDRCSACFAICLQSSHTGDLPYVVELFLNQDPATYENLRCFLNFVLVVMKKKLKSFKIATGKQLGEELVVEVIQLSEICNLTSSNSEQLDVFPIEFKSVWYGQKEDQYIEDEQVQASPNLKKAEKGKRKTSLHISLEDLKPHFGKKLKDVEQELGVGRSTIKRACREYGIYRWPGNKKQARNPSLFRRREGSAALDQQDICMQPSSSNGLIQRRDTNKVSTEHPIVEKVMIKVKCREDTIKFELCLSLGVCTLLFEQVSRRLNLKMGSFKLKYLDEDGDEILIACDDDLQFCPKTQTAMGKTCIQIYVQ